MTARTLTRRNSIAAAAAFAAGLGLLFTAIPAAAADPQLGKIGSIAGRVKDVSDQLTITEEQEQNIGAGVSQKIRDRYGVVQDSDVTRYVTLVGTVLAQQSSRPKLPWKFIVLDTDGVNAFAAPGGYVHITRGALALMDNEAELADVLGHEMIHVTEKHTLAAIKKGKMVQVGSEQTNLNQGSELLQKFIDAATNVVLQGFGRSEELESDQKGIRLANAVGYAPGGLSDFLTRLSERNKASTQKQGLFASHPDMKERLDKLRQQVTGERLASTATVAERYKKFVTYQPTAQADIAVVEAGAAGLTGGGGKEEPKKEEAKSDNPPPKKRFGIGSLLAPGSSDKKSAEVTGSSAARGVDKELGAKGGPVKTPVVVTLTPADIAAFKKEGGLK